MAWAEACGKKLKLLGRAIRQADGRVCAYVSPHLVDVENPLAGVEDVFNAIAVKGNAIGDVMFYGRGAGKLPTASAVVADVIDAAKHRDEKKRVFEAGVLGRGRRGHHRVPRRPGLRLVRPGLRGCRGRAGRPARGQAAGAGGRAGG